MTRGSKRLIALLLMLVACLSFFPAALADTGIVASGRCGDHLTWTLDEEGTLTIAGSGPMWAQIECPEQIYPWKKLRGEIRTVNLEDGVTSIGSRAFYGCSVLNTARIPSSVSSVRAEAFQYCYSLESVSILNSRCEIFQGTETLGFPGTVKIYGLKGSTAQAYAENCGYRFELFNPFVDVTEDKYYFEAAVWAYCHIPKISAGADDTHFDPNSICTREQAVTFLWKACGAPEPASAVNPFTDVEEGKYYCRAVLWAYENEIAGGSEEGRFGVGQACTREQAVTFLWKACGAPEPVSAVNPFTDVKTDKYYGKAVLWAYENEIAGGVSESKYGVGQDCTRGQLVAFMFKCADILG